MSSTVLAGPPGDCCFKGVKHTGEAIGRKIQIGGVDTYISEPPTETQVDGKPRGVILYFPDVYGPFFINAQLLQDYYASKGFVVLGVDYFYGDPVQNHDGEPGFDRKAWRDKHWAVATATAPKWTEAVKEMYGKDVKYFALGYCFGGPFPTELAATDEVSAAAFAHPTSLTEDHFKNIKKPLLLACAETDQAFPASSRHRAEDILAEIKATYLVLVFSGVSHGFATRGDLNDPNALWAKEEAARNVIEWFTRFSK